MSAAAPISEAAKQIQAEREGGKPLTASEERDIRASQALLDSRASPSIILEGENGTGKTTSLETLLKDANGKFEGPSVSGIEKVVMLTLEPGFEDTVGHIPASKLAWKYIPVSEGSWEGLMQMVKVINTATTDAMQKMGGLNRGNYPQFDHLLGSCSDFTDERTNQSLGPVFKFPQNWCFWFESISALSEVAKNCAIGDKPFMEPRDYQMVQFPIMKFLHHLVFGTKCLFVATAHLERETNPNNNFQELQVSTVGRAIGPKIPRFFSDVIVTDRVDTPGMNGAVTSKFTWATVKPGVRTKTRNLSWATELKADFVPLLNRFRERQAKGKQA